MSFLTYPKIRRHSAQSLSAVACLSVLLFVSVPALVNQVLHAQVNGPEALGSTSDTVMNEKGEPLSTSPFDGRATQLRLETTLEAGETLSGRNGVAGRELPTRLPPVDEPDGGLPGIPGPSPIDITVNPAHPNEYHNVELTVSGTWPNGCAPRLASYELDGDTFNIATTIDDQTFCPSVVTDWAFTIELDQLSPQEYGVFVFGAVQRSARFTVMRGDEALVELDPPMPFFDQEITVTVSGTWVNSCVPEYSSHEIVDGTLQIVTQLLESDICLDAVTDWTFDLELGTLAAGPYSLEVSGSVTAERTFFVATHRLFIPITYGIFIPPQVPAQ